MGTSREDRYIFLISLSVILRIRNVSDKSCTETRDTHFIVNNFFFSENLTVYEIMWENVEERGRPQMTIRHMRIACWIPKATNTHTGCAIFITFPVQQWLHERDSVLRYSTLPGLLLLIMGHFSKRSQ
jgi:hypothetical protein